MPFTSSHPAIVLPLAYLLPKYVSMAGLVTGSLMPDFEYFFRMEPKSTLSHTIVGILLFCLPVGLLSSYVFHNIIRNTLIDNLPLFLKARFFKIKQFNWDRQFIEHWFVEMVSIIVGACSHILWDSFTHGQYKIYQHPSTAVGAIIICYVIYKIPKNKETVGKIDKKYWIIFILLVVIILFIRFLTGLQIHFEQIGKIIVSTISACLISIAITSFIYRPRKNDCL